MPIVPPPPPRLSMITDWPSRSPSCAATARPTRSLEPPGGNGMSRSTGYAGQGHHILINLYGLLYKEITASSLAKIDLDGNVIWKPDTDYYVNKAGYVIHGAIHRARPDVRAVIHTHTPAGMAVAAMQCGLLPVSQTSIRFEGHIGYHDYEGPAVHPTEQERLVRDLGAHNAMILRSHGLLSCGPSVPEAFNTMYQLALSRRTPVATTAA